MNIDKVKKNATSLLIESMERSRLQPPAHSLMALQQFY